MSDILIVPRSPLGFANGTPSHYTASTLDAQKRYADGARAIRHHTDENEHEAPNVIVSAPRPVRLFTRPSRFPPSSPTQTEGDFRSDASPPSPPAFGGRTSTMSSEALEEFLSILRPSFFPSSSSSLVKHRRSLTMPTFYERPLALRPKPLRVEHQASAEPDVSVIQPSAPSTPPAMAPGELFDSYADASDQECRSTHWFRFGPLSSPVSRIHTRNPFIKQIAELSNRSIRAMSPAAIPLPTPSPDEEERLLQD